MELVGTACAPWSPGALPSGSWAKSGSESAAGAESGAVSEAESGAGSGSGDDRLLAAARAAVNGLAAVPGAVSEYRPLRESTLLELNRLAARARELSAALGAVIAGEIAHRSSPGLGSAGLAQRTGFRTPEEFVRASTGSTGRDAAGAVRAGRLMREAATTGEVDPLTGEVTTPGEPWLAPVAAALTERRLSIAAADSIRAGLGSPDSSIDGASLAGAAAVLCSEASSLDPDRLFRRARQLRDELDAAGIGIREEERRRQRSLRLTTLLSGMGRLVWLMDPETLATVKDVYDRMTSPKLGGVRFVSGDARDRAQQILRDDRAPQQLASDGFTQLLRLGADANPRFLIGSGAPVVTVLTTAPAVTARTGHGRLEGHPDPVSMATIERLRCAGATLEATLDENGQPLDLGREHRLYSRRQKKALAIRDGGCLAPGCDRPPSWCEAHHIQYWARDGGRTDLVDGVLLCRHHHLLFHNNGWEIRRDQNQRYWLIPPANLDPRRTPIAMPSKSAVMRDLGVNPGS